MSNRENTPKENYSAQEPHPLPDTTYAEEDLLGCIIKWTDESMTALGEEYPDLVPLHFGEPRNSVFMAIRNLWAEHGSAGVKPTLIAMRLQGRLSADEIGSYAARLGDQEDVLLYARQVFDVAKRREFRQALMNLYIGSADMTYDECVLHAQQRIFPPLTPAGAAEHLQSLGDLAYSYWEAVDQRKNSAPTGFAELDKRIGKGLQPERLYVLIGGTGSGKTTLANQIAEHIASAGRPVFYVTSEDTPSALLAKTVARLGNIDYNAVLYGYSSTKNAIDDALEKVLGRKSVETLVYLHDTGAFSLEQMQEQARRHFERFADGGPGVLVIDYLQRMARMQPTAQGGRADTRELVTQYVMRLRAVAEALGCGVVALSSQSRASYGGNSDLLASAKESGDIEYTADCILALSPDNLTSDKKNGTQPAPGHAAYKLTLAKNRLGPANETIALDWVGARQQFAGVEY